MRSDVSQLSNHVVKEQGAAAFHPETGVQRELSVLLNKHVAQLHPTLRLNRQ
jgi:hypothetical protein